jgi:hypothetical protein
MKPARLIPIALFAVSIPLAFAQSAAGTAYRIDFNLRDKAGAAPAVSRQYSMLVEEGGSGNVRIGTKIPYAVNPNQFQYADIGVNLDCKLHERGSSIALNVNVEISDTLVPTDPKTPPGQPIINQFRSGVSTVVQPGKPTVILSLDGANGNHKYEVEATVNRVAAPVVAAKLIEP